jgi:hypothetical protein
MDESAFFHELVHLEDINHTYRIGLQDRFQACGSALCRQAEQGKESKR